MTDDPITGSVSQQLAEAAEELERIREAYNISCQNIVTLTDKCTKFTEALMRAMTLIDELMRENGRLCAASDTPPSVRLFAAKASWDTSMHRLLGDKEDEPPSPSEKREESDNESEVKGEAT